MTVVAADRLSDKNIYESDLIENVLSRLRVKTYDRRCPSAALRK